MKEKKLYIHEAGADNKEGGRQQLMGDRSTVRGGAKIDKIDAMTCKI